MKHCNTCGETKERSQFSSSKGKKDGLQSKCKACDKLYRQSRSKERTAWADKYNKTTKGRYSHFISNAKRRGHLIDIEYDRYKAITSQPCAYCGDTESLRGLDRVYNDFPYTIENVVSCCAECNYAKHTRDFDVFFNWIDKMAERRRSCLY